MGRILERLSGRLTPPETTLVDGTQMKLLPIADLFMILMFSRPPGGSLRTARVTLVTIWLASTVAVLVGIPGLVILAHRLATFNLISLVVGLVSTVLGSGSAVLAVFGVRQRILIGAERRRVA